jgi:CRISPR/Cas system-associated protein Cas10 (large subunit of type III CRISPR-Cas system)
LAVFGRAAIEAEMNEEIRSHVEELEEDYRRSGLSARRRTAEPYLPSEELSKSKNDTVTDIDCPHLTAFSRTLCLPRECS